MSGWFSVSQAASDLYVLSEYRHWEETHCYLLNGSERSLLIDTGLGIGNIYEEVARLTDKPVSVVTTHVHWDHIGGHRYFPDFYVHPAEEAWINGKFPIPLPVVRRNVLDRCDPPAEFDIAAYQIFQGAPAGLVEDGDVFDLGGRKVEVLHTPGHSPGHMCLWEAERGWLYTGDLIYKGTLYAFYPSTDPVAYLASLNRVAALPVERLFPGHHSLDIAPEIIPRMRDAFRRLETEGKLCHGSGTFDYGDWSVQL